MKLKYKPNNNYTIIMLHFIEARERITHFAVNFILFAALMILV